MPGRRRLDRGADHDMLCRLILKRTPDDSGILHADQLDALVFDAMEPLRGTVDDKLLTLLRKATFHYGDATPMPDGTCRLHPELCRTIASSCKAKHRSIVALVGTLKYRLLHGLKADD